MAGEADTYQVSASRQHFVANLSRYVGAVTTVVQNEDAGLAVP